MADKDIDIHIKASGTPEARRNLDAAAKGLNEIGEAAQSTTPKVEKTSGAMSKFFGIIGNAAFFAAMATAAKRIAEFFDGLKAKADQAVEAAQNVRQAYDGLFEALGATTEGSRKETVKQTEQLLIQSGATAQVGLPTIESYTRQFKGAMPDSQYNIGLQSALSYAARHGGAATPELIQMMRGWNFNTVQQQQDMYRLIMGASGQSGLTDNELIDLLGRASPTARTLGWGPQQTISVLSTLAAGEIGRNKTMRPAQAIEAYAADAQKALQEYPAMQRIVPAVPVTEASDHAEIEAFMRTLEAMDAQTKAKVRQVLAGTGAEKEAAKAVREIGAAEQQAKGGSAVEGFLDWANLFPESRKEWSAYQKWLNSLTPEQRENVRSQLTEFRKNNPNTAPLYPFQPAEQEWWFRRMTPEKRLDALQSPPQTNIIHYHNDIHYNQTPPPAGPRVTPSSVY